MNYYSSVTYKSGSKSSDNPPSLPFSSTNQVTGSFTKNSRLGVSDQNLNSMLSEIVAPRPSSDNNESRTELVSNSFLNHEPITVRSGMNASITQDRTPQASSGSQPRVLVSTSINSRIHESASISIVSGGSQRSKHNQRREFDSNEDIYDKTKKSYCSSRSMDRKREEKEREERGTERDERDRQRKQCRESKRSRERPPEEEPDRGPYPQRFPREPDREPYPLQLSREPDRVRYPQQFQREPDRVRYPQQEREPDRVRYPQQLPRVPSNMSTMSRKPEPLLFDSCNSVAAYNFLKMCGRVPNPSTCSTSCKICPPVPFLNHIRSTTRKSQGCFFPPSGCNSRFCSNCNECRFNCCCNILNPFATSPPCLPCYRFNPCKSSPCQGYSSSTNTQASVNTRALFNNNDPDDGMVYLRFVNAGKNRQKDSLTKLKPTKKITGSSSPDSKTKTKARARPGKLSPKKPSREKVRDTASREKVRDTKSREKLRGKKSREKLRGKTSREKLRGKKSREKLRSARSMSSRFALSSRNSSRSTVESSLQPSRESSHDFFRRRKDRKSGGASRCDSRSKLDIADLLLRLLQDGNLLLRVNRNNLKNGNGCTRPSRPQTTSAAPTYGRRNDCSDPYNCSIWQKWSDQTPTQRDSTTPPQLCSIGKPEKIVNVYLGNDDTSSRSGMTYKSRKDDKARKRHKTSDPRKYYIQDRGVGTSRTAVVEASTSLPSLVSASLSKSSQASSKRLPKPRKTK